MILRGFCTIMIGMVLLAGSAPGQKRKNGLESGYDKWINEDVSLIISDDERKAFHQLGTDDEREQFVEQFWLRRDPTPETVENEYQEEHYRRIAYANAHFASGIPGWRTDRGRTYIRFGPPDEIDSHPSGGTYQRPAEQGGGSTSTYPFEVWRYRYLEGVGQNVEVEFVDPSGSGEYRMTIDPCEKDALKYTPGAGPTLSEQFGQSTRAARFQNTNGTTCGPPLNGVQTGQNQFDRIERLANLSKAPPIRFKDLEAVDSRVTFNVLPLTVHVDYLRMTNFSVLANITVQFDNAELQFQTKDGLEKGGVNLLGQIFTMSRRPTARFEKALEIDSPVGMLQQTVKQKSVYQQTVPLAPGRYRLQLTARDVVSGNMGRTELVLDVPRFDDETLATSSLILADEISRLPSKNVGGVMFSIGDKKVRPRVDGKFSRSEKMGIYFEIYNLTSTENVTYEIDHEGTAVQALRFTEEMKASNQVTVEKLLPLNRLDPGAYTLRVKVAQGGEGLERKVRFVVAN